MALNGLTFYTRLHLVHLGLRHPKSLGIGFAHVVANGAAEAGEVYSCVLWPSCLLRAVFSQLHSEISVVVVLQQLTLRAVAAALCREHAI